MTLPVELCALCGREIPYFSSALDDEAAEWCEFQLMDPGDAVAHLKCLDEAPLFAIAAGRPREVAA